MFRHTYCATRLQTLDQGAPVSLYTVGKELGHGGDSLVRRVYGHLGEVRHRAAEWSTASSSAARSSGIDWKRSSGGERRDPEPGCY